MLFTCSCLILLSLATLVIGSGYDNIADHDFEEVIQSKVGACQAVSVNLCEGFEYNMTMYPNLLNHQSQDEALLEITQFLPLIRTRCNAKLRFFLCVVYVPICVALSKPVPPCRDLCLAVRWDCESLINRCGFTWPAALECDRFPTDGLCIALNVSAADPLRRRSIPRRLIVDITSKNLHSAVESRLFQCPRRLLSTNDSESMTTSDSLVVGDELVPHCLLPCNFLLSTHERYVLRLWIGVWSALSAISSLFTVLTYLINRRRFFYPERTMIFLSVCCMAVSLVYFIGVLLGGSDDAGGGDSTPCRRLTTVQLSSVGSVQWLYDYADMLYDGQWRESGVAISVVRRGATSDVGCTILAVIDYFFTIAGHVWWVILNITWFMSAGLKWSHEAIEARGTYLHVSAWTIAALMTVVVLATDSVDGDVLSGLCSVGNVDMTALQRLVITPLLVSFVLGVVFLAAGIRSLFKVRKYVRANTAERCRLEQLMIRISVFSILYAVPALILCVCHVSFVTHLPKWLVLWYDVQCRNRLTKRLFGFPDHCPVLPRLASIKPHFMMFMVKYLTILMLGLTTGFWTWSVKTIGDWSRFCIAARHRLLCAVRRNDLLIP